MNSMIEGGTWSQVAGRYGNWNSCPMTRLHVERTIGCSRMQMRQGCIQSSGRVVASPEVIRLIGSPDRSSEVLVLYQKRPL